MISMDCMLRDIAAGIVGYRVMLEPPGQVDKREKYILLTAHSECEKPTGALLERRLSVEFACISGDKISGEDMDSFAGTVTLATTPTVGFCGRHIVPYDFSTEMKEGVGYVRFKLHFWDDAWGTQEYETMETLSINEEVINGNTDY